MFLVQNMDLNWLTLFFPILPSNPPERTSKSLWFSGDFRGYTTGTLARHELIKAKYLTKFLKAKYH